MTELTGIRLPDYLVVATYFAVIIFAGYYFSRYIRRVKDYFAAGNIMPWWLSGTSYYMASFTTLMFVVYNEIAYVYGFVAVTITWIGSVTILISGYLLAHRWRRARILTPVAYIERRFNNKVHQLFVWIGIPYRLLDNGLRIFSTAIIITIAIQHPAVSFNHFVIIVGIIMIAYTLLGGQLAVIITDFIQAIIIVIAVTMLFVLMLSQIDNISHFIASLPEGFLSPARKPYNWSYLLFTTFALSIIDQSSGWAMVQKYNTVRSDRDARKMVYYLTIIKVIMPPIFFFPGIAARYLLPTIENTRAVYAVISMTILPVGLMGFMIAAMLSATMSSLGSEFNTLSGILTRDFYKKIINPHASEQREVFFGRVSTLVIGLVTITIAILMYHIRGLTLMDIMYRYFTAFAPPLAIPVVTGLLFKKINSRGVTWGVIGGVVVGITAQVVNLILVQKYADLMAINERVDFWLRSGWNSAASMTGITTVILGMWLGTRTKETPPDEKERVEVFFTDLKKPYELDHTKIGTFSPFRIMGPILAILGGAMILISILVAFGYHDMLAFWLDMFVGLLLVTVGIIMRLKSSKYLY